MPLQNRKAWLLEQCVNAFISAVVNIKPFRHKEWKLIQLVNIRFRIWGAVHSVYITFRPKISQGGLYPSKKETFERSWVHCCDDGLLCLHFCAIILTVSGLPGICDMSIF